MATPSSVSGSQPTSRPPALKRASTLLLFVVGMVVLGFLAPSLMGLAMLALLVVVPVAVVGGICCVLWNSACRLRRPQLAPEPEPEQQIASSC